MELTNENFANNLQNEFQSSMSHISTMQHQDTENLTSTPTRLNQQQLKTQPNYKSPRSLRSPMLKSKGLHHDGAHENGVQNGIMPSAIRTFDFNGDGRSQTPRREFLMTTEDKQKMEEV